MYCGDQNKKSLLIGGQFKVEKNEYVNTNVVIFGEDTGNTIAFVDKKSKKMFEHR